jgi:predicted TIM-barrel fold metal-dependent hydrolase
MTADPLAAPGLIFDSHLHIIDPRFPLVPNQGYLPDAFPVGDYLATVRSLGVGGGAVVSGSFQAFDQTCLLDALAALGPTFVGVIQLPADCPDERIRELDRAGVRAVRFNLRRGGSAGVRDIEALGHRVFDVAGWHSEFYVRSADLADLEPVLRGLPRVSIDHLGLTREGFDVLLRLVDAGAHVKATGFSRCDLDIADALRRIDAGNPNALMFGTDLPSTRAPRPFQSADIELISDTLGTAAPQVLRDNAVRLYRPVLQPG